MRSLYLLHVEDDDNDAFFVERAFANAKIDLTIHRVADGQAAIDYLAGSGKYQDREKYPLPQIMLLDLKLPLRDGFEVLEWARGPGGISLLAHHCAELLSRAEGYS